MPFGLSSGLKLSDFSIKFHNTRRTQEQRALQQKGKKENNPELHYAAATPNVP